MYKKFSYTARESYALNYIAKVEIGKQKTDEGKHTGFNLFQTDHQQFIDYNIGDVDLVGELDNKLKLIKLICTMAYSAKCNYDDVFSQVRTWDCIIYNYLLEHDIVIPFTKKEEKKSKRRKWDREKIEFKFVDLINVAIVPGENLTAYNYKGKRLV